MEGITLSKVEEKLAKSLTAETTELIPYLPYLLQDLWELGSSPRDMLELIRKHIHVSAETKILDLACGKGAVSVNLAKELGCMVRGIDLIPEFIDFARKKAIEYGVEALCEFIVGDINEAVNAERDYDLVVLGAVGVVLGTPEETIRKLKQTIKPEGYILIDDAYGKKGVGDGYCSREEWLLILEKMKVRLIAEKIVEEDELIDLNREQQGLIRKRANELMKKYPEKANLFGDYIRSQQAECDLLENDVIGVTMLIQKMK
ncbi:MAG TPA: class I SAM-dependent methyltransferase [Firmicutes bacterium]|jgi:2-polyprenyl-3-methyl-5-hydroxy-6-metoxy-1,4-benzoquinol methylase|nr:class I SAM-dependent methyltransferase [Bacillota bacterium]